METWHDVSVEIGRFIQFMTKNPVRFTKDGAQVFATDAMMKTLYECLPASQE